jgi:flagellar protein FlaI
MKHHKIQKKHIKEHHQVHLKKSHHHINKPHSRVQLPETKPEKRTIGFRNPATPLGIPIQKTPIQALPQKVEPKPLSPPPKPLQTYSLEVDKAKVEVSIERDDTGLTYKVSLPQINPATSALLSEVRNDLIASTNISMKELVDPEAFNSIKSRFMSETRRLLHEKVPHIELETEEFLSSILLQDMLGLGKIEFLINDQNLEEIVLQSAKENVRVYSKKYGWLRTNIQLNSEEEIMNYAHIIARRVGRQITVLTPLLDAHLVTGDRINAVLYPISTKGNTITIRKFARDPYTIVDLIGNKTCDLDTAALLWLAIEYEMNVLISGGTASGKTSFLNACLPFMPPNHRVITIEDTRELVLPEYLYWTPLVTRTPNPEGKGEVTMLDLLVNSLRMRPDRIILGEMRRHEEAMVLFEAMHTGHSVYATVHADSASETISRLVNPPLNVPANLLKSVNLNVIMFRDRKKGIRRVLQVAEFDVENNDARANILYRWSAEEDKMIAHNESSNFFEKIERITGMTQAESKKDLEEKKRILNWLLKHQIRSLQDVGTVMSAYYRNPEQVRNALQRDNPKLVLSLK